MKLDQPRIAPATDDRFRILVQSVYDYAIYMLDPQGVIVSWNPGAERFKGYTQDEIIGQHFSRFYTEEDLATDLPSRALDTARREGRFEAEGWRVRKDGTRFWANVVIDAIRGTSGELIGFAKVTRDLTERKLAQDALRLSEERFRLLVQGVTDYAIYMLSPEGIVTSWNAGAERFKGYTQDEIIGQHFSRFYTEEDLATDLPSRALETARREGRFEAEGWRVRKEGTRFWANVVIDAIRDPSGELIGFAKVTRDLTERKITQEALAETRARLVQSQKMEAVGQLTGGIAHDFNNLLTAVLGSLELLSNRIGDDPKSKRLIENAIQGAQRGASLTQRMLAFARRQDLKIEAVDVPALIRGMAHLLERSVGSSFRIETRFPLRLTPARGDPNQLELAILNLVLNARDAMPRGGTIVISAQEDVLPSDANGLERGEYIRLIVADTGEGMDEATLARAAEPFFTTKGVGRGTGLGLSMVHGVAEQSGGRLILKSRKGEGTTAEIWLCRADSGALTQADQEQEGPAGTSSRAATVLVVDDDSLVLNNTTAMLEDLGHTVIEATSAEEALLKLRRMHAGHQPVDLVITDQVMSRMTGLELSVVIRDEFPDVPVVLASGYAELPADAPSQLPRLAKPFRQGALARTIARCVPERSERSVVPFRSKR